MKFDTIGNQNNPIIIMLAGSFCPGECMEYIYGKMSDDYFIIVPTYNGHYAGSKDFTTRENEASEIVKYLIENEISHVQMVYGQSMGAEIGIELMRQMIGKGIDVGYGFFDGAPCVKLSKLYKIFMYYKFKVMINMARKKTVDDIVNMKFLQKFTNGDTQALRAMIEDLIAVSPFLSNQSIKNETECCYTFDFPTFSEEMQKRMFFFYAAEEKAYKACYKYVKKAYPDANYKMAKGYGHLTYSVKHTNEYVKCMKGICATYNR